MNREEFIAAVGREPEGDDLERANCPDAGTFAHWGCGVCEHGKPVFTCPPCFIVQCQKSFKRINDEEETETKEEGSGD